MNGAGRSPERPAGAGRPPRRRRPRAAGQPGGDPEAPRSIGGSLDEYLASQGLLGMRTLGEIVACWAGVVGEDVAAHAQPRSLEGTELVVGVDRPGWATQLGFLSAAICDRLADQLGYRAVETVRTHVDARFRLD